MKIVSAIAMTLLIWILAPTGEAAVPQTNSPISRGEHPRLFFTGADLPALRDRIATHYRTEFQAFIDLLNDTSVLSSGQKTIENHWGSLNYAFMAALDPQQMQQRGFIFSAPLDTAPEYCDKALAYAKTFLVPITAATDQGHGDLATGYPQSIYFPVMAAYDWCYSNITTADKTALVDAFVAAYIKKYTGQNLLNMEVAGLDMLANNQASADIHDILGIVAFYNDPYPSAAIQSELYDAFHAIWINRVLVELNYFYKTATGWHEGSGGYINEGFANLGIPIGMFSSALGTDYIASTPHFYNYPLFAEANLKPHSLLSQCGASGTVSCPEYLERWGTISGGISGIGCKTAVLTAGMLRKSNHPNASLAKWLYQQTGGSCSTAVTQYGGTWSNAVLFWFIYGDREITAQSPTDLKIAKTQKLGLGEYVMKSGYNGSDSQIVFWAKEHNMYGHDSPDYGSFSLHKFGNLILKPANSKSGDAVLSSSRFNLFENVIGLHKGVSDPTHNFNGNMTDPFFGARGITRINTAGRLLAETINNVNFDYIAYDNSASWDPTTADISQREFVYLKGSLNKEYVVVFDRMNVKNPSTDEKIWKIWVSAQPEFVNGTSTNPRTGKWTSTNTDTMSVTNQFSSLKTPNFESAPTHGRFFVKTLSPDSFRINVLGGPGKEFQGGDDDGLTPWGAPTMTQGMYEYLGWGRIEVVPTVAKNYDAFLHVIQFGDSNTLSSMTSTQRIDSTDGKMMGADIRDTVGNRVVLFSAALNGSPVTGSVAYAFKPAATTSKHLLVNMAPSTAYHITQNSGALDTLITVATAPQSGSVTVTSNSQGVLGFTVSGLTIVADMTPPSPPKNLKLQ